MAGNYDIRDSEGRVTGSISPQRSYESNDENPVGILIGSLLGAGLAAVIAYYAMHLGLGFEKPLSNMVGLGIGGAIALWAIWRAITNPEFWRIIFGWLILAVILALVIGAVNFVRAMNGL